MQTAEINGLAGLLDRFDRRTRVARASELALCDRLLEAEGLLAPMEKTSLTSEELDLLARIRVRQGAFADALRLWQASMIHSENPKNMATCMRSLEGFAARKFKRQSLNFLILWFFWSVIVCGVVILMVWRAWR